LPLIPKYPDAHIGQSLESSTLLVRPAGHTSHVIPSMPLLMTNPYPHLAVLRFSMVGAKVLGLLLLGASVGTGLGRVVGVGLGFCVGLVVGAGVGFAASVFNG